MKRRLVKVEQLHEETVDAVQTEDDVRRNKLKTVSPNPIQEPPDYEDSEVGLPSEL